jgi:hypothetical protein
LPVDAQMFLYVKKAAASDQLFTSIHGIDSIGGKFISIFTF